MIAVNHLTKTFGGLVAVQDASFEVDKREIFAFLGPNGAGKPPPLRARRTRAGFLDLALVELATMDEGTQALTLAANTL